MAAVWDSLSLKGGPLGRAGLRLRDGCRDLGLRQPDHGHPASGGEKEDDHNRDAGPQQVGGAPVASGDRRASMAQYDQERSHLQRQEQGQDDGQQPMHDGGFSPAAPRMGAECTLLRKKSQVE
jgi:hypothetical protein